MQLIDQFEMQELPLEVAIWPEITVCEAQEVLAGCQGYRFLCSFEEIHHIEFTSNCIIENEIRSP